MYESNEIPLIDKRIIPVMIKRIAEVYPNIKFIRIPRFVF